MWCNGEGLTSDVGENVRWHMGAIGSEESMHNFHWWELVCYIAAKRCIRKTGSQQYNLVWCGANFNLFNNCVKQISKRQTSLCMFSMTHFCAYSITRLGQVNWCLCSFVSIQIPLLTALPLVTAGKCSNKPWPVMDRNWHVRTGDLCFHAGMETLCCTRVTGLTKST